MLIKIAMLSAGIYVSLLLMLDFAIFLAVRFTYTIIGLPVSRLRLGLLFGLTWLISFNLAWRILRLSR
jgi:hypothetical protein